MPVENIACGNCGTTISFNLDSGVEEFATSDHKMCVKEEGSKGGLLSTPNYTHTGTESKDCPNCEQTVSVLTVDGFQRAMDEIEIEEDEAVIKIWDGKTIRRP